MSTLTANDLKTRGVAAIEALLAISPRPMISVRGKDRFVVMEVAQYHYLRECELDAALAQSQADMAAGRYVVETAPEHMARLETLLAAKWQRLQRPSRHARTLQAAGRKGHPRHRRRRRRPPAADAGPGKRQHGLPARPDRKLPQDRSPFSHGAIPTQGQYAKTLALLEANPHHPSLRLHALGGQIQGPAFGVDQSLVPDYPGIADPGPDGPAPSTWGTMRACTHERGPGYGGSPWRIVRGQPRHPVMTQPCGLAILYTLASF